MAASHPHLFQPSVADENEICKLIQSYFLLYREVLQWCPATGEDIPTPNTNEIVVFASYHCGFGLLVCDFLHGLLDYYQIKLVHLNPNSIPQITVFVHLHEAYLGIPTNFPLFKNYFFLKYQASATSRKVIGGVGLQTSPCAGFLDLPLKISLRRWYGIWLYYENHEPSLPSFVDTSSGGPDRLRQPLDREGLDRRVHGHPSAGPPSPTSEKASPYGMGVQQTLRPNLGNSRKDGSRTFGEASRRNIPRYLLMAS
jgi:hypothetical protein